MLWDYVQWISISGKWPEIEPRCLIDSLYFKTIRVKAKKLVRLFVLKLNIYKLQLENL